MRGPILAQRQQKRGVAERRTTYHIFYLIVYSSIFTRPCLSPADKLAREHTYMREREREREKWGKGEGKYEQRGRKLLVQGKTICTSLQQLRGCESPEKGRRGRSPFSERGKKHSSSECG